MATDMFLLLDGVKGEAKDAAGKHNDEIEVSSWSWGATQTGSSHGGGGSGTGKVQVADLTIVKFVDKSTPVLFQMCAKGTSIASGKLTLRKAGGNPLEYLVISFKQAIVSSVNQGGAGSDDRVPETLTLNFASVQIDYTPQKPDGGPAATVSAPFDIAGNG